MPIRKTTQALAPLAHRATPPGHYGIYPSFPLGPMNLGAGYEALARELVRGARDPETAGVADARSVILDGYGGVLWDDVRDRLDGWLRELGVGVNWTDVRSALRSHGDIDHIVEPFLGGDDPLWGTRYTGALDDLFDSEALAALRADPNASMNIIYGEGAALAGWPGRLVYVDVPKNEIQFRSRAASVAPLGARDGAPLSAKAMYKRFYFVDWPALDRHKQKLLPHIDLFIDSQRPEDPVFVAGDTLRTAFSRVARNFMRPRPWFEPGPWGGQWIKDHIPELPREAPNYAWSFELIAPENGIMFESDGVLLEVSFDTLMFQEYRAVLGRAADRFGSEFPIRFDFLDTFGGGNLSVQVHPRVDYIRENFGERFTQDETYYILDCKPGARVYLGFNEGIDPAAFRAELERSRNQECEIDVDEYVNTVPASKHALYLIPHGTIHCSGRDNLVLEISATPYIFTFKMYDWVRRDLDGALRPINIERAFDNLAFDRTASVVERELISRPSIISEGSDWRIVHLPTHRDHFYDVRRIEFDTRVEVETDDDCHVMSLVEGSSIILETDGGMRQRFNYAETFVVPAAARAYRLVNEGSGRAMVVQAYVKHN